MMMEEKGLEMYVLNSHTNKQHFYYLRCILIVLALSGNCNNFNLLRNFYTKTSFCIVIGTEELGSTG